MLIEINNIFDVKYYLIRSAVRTTVKYSIFSQKLPYLRGKYPYEAPFCIYEFSLGDRKCKISTISAAISI